MAKTYLIEKDGWHVEFINGKLHWIETAPTYNTVCPVCGGSGKGAHAPHCDCEGLDWRCTNHETCWKCNGLGKLQDEPNHPMPSVAILNKLAYDLKEVFQKYGEMLKSGELERIIAEEKAREDSISSSSL